MTVLRLDVEGMGCPDCVRSLTARLRDVPGVTAVSADHRVSVVLLVGSMTRADVLAALAGTRFAVRRIGPGHHPASAGQENGQARREPSGPQPPDGGPIDPEGTS